MAAREIRALASDIFNQLTARGLDGREAISVVTEIISLITSDLAEGGDQKAKAA